MTIPLKDLVNITKVSKKMNIDSDDLLLDALDDKYQLYALSTRNHTVELLPCYNEWIEEVDSFIDMYKKNDMLCIEITIGQVLSINHQAIKELIVNKQCSEILLFRELGPELDASPTYYWKTSAELYKFGIGECVDPHLAHVHLDNIFMLKEDVRCLKNPLTITTNRHESASNGSLKVIGLLMSHLAKTPKYASGISPNKTQIKELLLDLAVELDINNYGLSKVDERLLVQAMKYLETQKI